MTVTKFITIMAEANALLKEHGLDKEGWVFEFSSTQHIMGDCDHSTKTIRFSKHYIMSDPRQVTDTLRHEVAHALVDAKHGHDATWKRMAMRVGADPYSYPDEFTAKTKVVNTAKPNYRIKCPNCGWSVTRFRLRRSLMTEKRDARCPHCHAKVEFYRIKR